MNKKIKKLLVFTLLFGSLLLFKTVLAQNLGLDAVDNGLGGSLSSTDPRELVGRIINIALAFLGVIAVGLIIYAGFIWMTSNGNEEKVAKAKNILKNAAIGLVIILASWGIASFIISRLGGASNGDGGASNGGGGGNGTCVGLNCNSCIGPNCDNPSPDCQGSNDPDCQPAENHPVITGISPLGGFCLNESSQPCNKDSDCSSSSCDLITPNGAPNNFITIFGKNFGTYSEATSTIIFGSNSNPVKGVNPNVLNSDCLNSWTDTQIIIAVPPKVSSGAIKIVNNNGLSDLTNDDYGPKIPDFQANNIIRPSLCALSPKQGILNSAIVYSGVNLHSSVAYFGNYQSNVQALKSSFIDSSGLEGTSTIPNIESGLSSSFVQVNINNFSEKSNYLSFTKKAQEGEGPFISFFTPTNGTSGQYLTIFGSGFGNQQGSSQVYIGNQEASYDFPAVCLNSVWQDKRIIVKVPEDLDPGFQIISIKLVSSDGSGSKIINTKNLNPNVFNFDPDASLKTSLCKINPSSGPVGTPVSLWGEYFGDLNSEGLINFTHEQNTSGNAIGTIEKDGQADLIKTIVPQGVLTGPLKVVKNNEWGNTLNFNFGLCTANTDCNGNQVCCPQNTYKKGRCVDDFTDCLINIPTSVFEWKFNTGFGNNTPPPPVPSNDPCAFFTSQQTCIASSTCCFDALATGGSKCRTGIQIPNNFSDNGYCAYYDCSVANSKLCASSTPVKNGDYKTVDSCVNDCPVKSPCTDLTNFNDCQNINKCCFDASSTSCFFGEQIRDSGDLNNGYCAYYDCQLPPSARLCATSTPFATGTYQGLDSCTIGCYGDIFSPICNCTKTSDCDNAAILTNQIACGADSCCGPRPQITSTLPANNADKVCRNSMIEVNFDQRMDISSFYNNFILLEQWNNGPCPLGTFAYNQEDIRRFLTTNNTWWKKLGIKVNSLITRLSGRFSKSALAEIPNSNQVYCSVPGLVYGQNKGETTTLIFSPKKILDAGANYYFIIKGDENLDNKTGILNYNGIAFNGSGYQDGSDNISGEHIKFNSHYYKNSQIIKFSTLLSQGETAGICTIDHVSVSPSSYLFKTTNNALKSLEDDSEAASTNKTFDTVADRDKVFSATAYSVDNQLLQPVDSYSWTWDFSLNNSIASLNSKIPNLPVNRILLSAQKGITDSSGQLKATINMPSSNEYLSGNRFNNSADFYIFICNNPWPPVKNDGTWSPWADQSQGNSSKNYNYKFYYCRDAGNTGSLDDLPAINSEPLTMGTIASNLICSTDHSVCHSEGASCGPQDDSGQQAGVCIWDVLKESYFLRSPILSPAIITNAYDEGTGGTIKINWKSASNNVAAYKIYYLAAGKSSLMSQEVAANSDDCSTQEGLNLCQKTISGLTNNLRYIFQISVISEDRTESSLSNAVVVTPSDITPPDSPTGLQAQVVATTTLKFTWNVNTDSVDHYRLYHGFSSKQYGEYFDSNKASLNFSTTNFPAGSNYFSLFAFDNYNNQSVARGELKCLMFAEPSSTDPNFWNKLNCSLDTTGFATYSSK